MHPTFEVPSSEQASKPEKSTQRRVAPKRKNGVPTHQEAEKTNAKESSGMSQAEIDKRLNLLEELTLLSDPRKERRALKYIADADISQLPPNIRRVRANLFFAGAEAGQKTSGEKMERLRSGLEVLRKTDPETAISVLKELFNFDIEGHRETQEPAEVSARAETPELKILAEMDSEEMPDYLKKIKASLLLRSSNHDRSEIKRLAEGFENLQKANPKRANEILNSLQSLEISKRPEARLLNKLSQLDSEDLPQEIKSLRGDLLFRSKQRNKPDIDRLIEGFQKLREKDEPLAKKYLRLLENFDFKTNTERENERKEDQRLFEEQQMREAQRIRAENEQAQSLRIAREKLDSEEADYKKRERSLEAEIKRLNQLESALKKRIQKATQSSSTVRRWLSSLTNGRFKTPEQIEIDGLNENLADVEKKMQEAMEDLQMHRYTHNRIPDRGTRLRTEPAVPKSMISMENRRRNERSEAEEVRASRGERELPKSSRELEKDFGVTELQEFENSIKQNPRLAVESLPNAAKLWDHLKDAMLKQKDDLNLDNSEIASAATEIVLRLAMYRKAMEMDDVDEAQKYQDQAEGIARAHGLKNNAEIAKVIDLE